MSLRTQTAQLVLEDGTHYSGIAFGALGTTVGEAVFTTAMTGYQETLTDPSYHRQIVIHTFPHIGNTGVVAEDDESRKYWAAGVVVRDPSRITSNWRAEGDYEEHLKSIGLVGICDVDTRALTLHLRDKGAMRMGIFSGDDAPKTLEEQLEVVRSAPQMKGADLASEVTVDEPYTVQAEGEKRFHVVAYDLGIKTTTLKQLAKRGIELTVVPANTSVDELEALKPDGVFFSNGPGDPAAMEQPIKVLQHVLENRIPFFGICFGNQLLGRALGFDTYKLTFGHRGTNQPVLDVASGRVEITTQNHGFAVDAPAGEPVTAPNAEFGRVQVSHIGLNDHVVEGLRCLDIPAFSVQFHPESAAGPHDSRTLFDTFAQLLADTAETKEN